MAYQILRSSFLARLGGLGLNKELTEKILTELDIVAVDFDIQEQTKALSVMENGVPELVKIYIAAKTIAGLSKSTLYNKLKYLTMFCQTVSKPLDKVTTNDLRVYLYQYKQERGISNDSLNSIRVILSSFFHWLACEGYIDRDPALTLEAIKGEKKQRNALSQIEMEYIRQAAKTARERAIVEFLYSTGCRVSELCDVKIADVDFLADEVHLFGKGRKHRSSYLNAKAHVALQEYLATRKDDCPYLFVSKRRPYHGIGSGCVEQMIRDLVEHTPVHTKTTPHVFRHTTATQAVAHGMAVEDVSALLGHENIATTMIYVETSRTQVKASHQKAVV